MSESLRKRVARAIIQREHNLTPEMAARAGCSICTDAADAAIAIVLKEAGRRARLIPARVALHPTPFESYKLGRADAAADILAALEMPNEP